MSSAVPYSCCYCCQKVRSYIRLCNMHNSLTVYAEFFEYIRPQWLTSCIEVCFYQRMSYTSKLNNGLIYPLQPYSWSFAESVIYKEAGYNLFLLTCISPGYLIYLHRKSPHFLNSSCKLKVGKNCILIISQGVSHLCSFFFLSFFVFLYFFLF